MNLTNIELSYKVKKGRPPIKVKRPLAYTLLNFIYKASLPLLCHILLVSQCYLSIIERMDAQKVQNEHRNQNQFINAVSFPCFKEASAKFFHCFISLKCGNWNKTCLLMTLGICFCNYIIGILITSTSSPL